MDAPAVAVSRDGKVLGVAWMAAPDGSKGRDVFWAVAKAGGGFGGDVLLPADSRGIQGHPSAAVDGDGAFHIVWEDGRADGTQIWYQSSAAGAKNVALSAPADGPATFPSLAVGTSVGVAWEQGGGVRFLKVK